MKIARGKYFIEMRVEDREKRIPCYCCLKRRERREHHVIGTYNIKRKRVQY